MVSKTNHSGEASHHGPWGVASGQFQVPFQALAFGPQLATESTRFWARRLHAYADWMTTMAQCTTPAEVMQAQSQFIARTQEDYAAESAALTKLASNAASDSASGG